MTTSLQDRDLPVLWHIANNASLKAQGMYARLVKADLILVLLGVLLSSFSSLQHEGKSWFAIAGAFLFLLAFLVSLALKFTRYEKTWYGARAVAESVKSLSWKYMMGADPYPTQLASGDADRKFASALSEFLTERQYLAFDFQTSTNQGPQITDLMRKIRASTTNERKTIYLKFRLMDQKNWYAGKAEFNRSKETTFFRCAIATQLIGFLWALYLIKEPESRNMTGFFSALAIALFSWMQIRKFQELAQVYALTAQELSLVEVDSNSVNSDNDLGVFVKNTENAISREHTMWMARRGE